MLASPLIALDLPLKHLIWDHNVGVTWLSYNRLGYLSDLAPPPVNTKGAPGVDRSP